MISTSQFLTWFYLGINQDNIYFFHNILTHRLYHFISHWQIDFLRILELTFSVNLRWLDLNHRSELSEYIYLMIIPEIEHLSTHLFFDSFVQSPYYWLDFLIYQLQIICNNFTKDTSQFVTLPDRYVYWLSLSLVIDWKNKSLIKL